MSAVRILVVDDFEPWRVYLRSLLKRKAWLTIVGEAVDGLEAVEKARALRPDLVLLDGAMPRVNGIEAARRIREDVPASKILFLSVERSSSFLEAVEQVGAHGFIPKAEASARLLSTLESLFPEKANDLSDNKL